MMKHTSKHFTCYPVKRSNIHYAHSFRAPSARINGETSIILSSLLHCLYDVQQFYISCCFKPTQKYIDHHSLRMTIIKLWHNCKQLLCLKTITS